MSVPEDQATIENDLRIGAGFSEDEHDGIRSQLSSLNSRLSTFKAAETEMELSIKERDRPGQKVTLECWIAGRQRIVATSGERELTSALADVRDDLRRQLNDSKTRQEPRNNRHLRG